MTATTCVGLDPVAVLDELLRLPSPTGAVDRAAGALASMAVHAGFDVSIDAAGNVVMRWGGAATPAADAAPGILLLGHLDTVPGDLPVRAHGGRMYGRGAVDAKGPLAAALAAVSSLPRLRQTALTMVAVVDEEGASRGAAHLRDHWPAPGCLIVLEPSGWDAVTTAYRGCLRLTAAVERPTAHHAIPMPSAADALIEQLGSLRRALDPAPAAAGRAVDRIQVRVNELRSSIDSDHDTAAAGLEIRLPAGSDVAATLGTAERAMDAELTVVSACEPVSVARSNAAVRALSRAIAAAGSRPRHLSKTGTSDLNVVWPRWRCDAAVYGPGDSALDHTAAESIEIAELRRGAEVLRAALELLR